MTNAPEVTATKRDASPKRKRVQKVKSVTIITSNPPVKRKKKATPKNPAAPKKPTTKKTAVQVGDQAKPKKPSVRKPTPYAYMKVKMDTAITLLQNGQTDAALQVLTLEPVKVKKARKPSKITNSTPI